MCVSGDERCIRLVRAAVTGKSWQAVGRILVGKTYYCTFIAEVARSGQPQCQSSQRHSTPSHWQPSPHHLRNAVQVAMKARLRVARRYTHTVRLHRDAEHDGT